ncbi:hypothetical protein BDW74DRAFT_160683 [Aspergillus multicolor]|uniref:uncharacterized protein n=1 Tax=Aspergillus multicolor TaxID=41759 RepID=UPI003CCDA84A
MQPNRLTLSERPYRSFIVQDCGSKRIRHVRSNSLSNGAFVDSGQCQKSRFILLLAHVQVHQLVGTPVVLSENPLVSHVSLPLQLLVIEPSCFNEIAVGDVEAPRVDPAILVPVGDLLVHASNGILGVGFNEDLNVRVAVKTLLFLPSFLQSRDDSRKFGALIGGAGNARQSDCVPTSLGFLCLFPNDRRGVFGIWCSIASAAAVAIYLHDVRHDDDDQLRRWVTLCQRYE